MKNILVKIYEFTFKFSMLITSFMPLWFCIGIMYLVADCEKPGKMFAIIVLSLFLVSAFFTVVYLFVLKRATKEDYKGIYEGKKSSLELTDVTLLRKINIEYLFGFILPLLIFDFNEIWDIICFLIIFATFAVLYFRYNIIYINIFLSIFLRYKIYECSVVTGASVKKAIFLHNGKFQSQSEFGCIAMFYGSNYFIVLREMEFSGE